MTHAALALTIVAAGLSSGGALAHDVVRIATEGACPPYSFINDAGEMDGLEIALGDEICTCAGLTCEWVMNEWDHTIISELASGSFDAIMAGLSITPERDEIIDVTQDYIPPAPSSYVGLSPDVEVTTGVVAAQTATLQAEHVAASGATLLEFATQDETIAAMRNGEANAAFTHTDFLAPFRERTRPLASTPDPRRLWIIHRGETGFRFDTLACNLDLVA